MVNLKSILTTVPAFGVGIALGAIFKGAPFWLIAYYCLSHVNAFFAFKVKWMYLIQIMSKEESQYV